MAASSMAIVIEQHHGEFKPFARAQRCKLQSFTQLDFSMLELSKADQNFAHSLKRAFEAVNFHRSFSTPCLSLSHRSEQEEYFNGKPRVEIVGGRSAPQVRALVVEVAIAMASGVDPIPVSSGLGGAYLLRSRHGDKLAVAKPIDEEPLAFNNPKGFVGQMLGQPGLKRSIRVGETGVRELAAYLLDHGRYAGVPPTALVKISHVAFHINNTDLLPSPMPFKIASLQRFVDHDSDAGDLGPSSFSVTSVHRIGILDVRLLNLDRHAGNLLVKNVAVGAAELVPIDHGLCLPEWLDDPYFEWLHWPQASLPFSESEIEYISNLDPLKDAELLRATLPSLQESSIRILVLCTIFLKRATAAGLCLAEIGQMMSRESCIGEEKFSVLENLCAEAKASMDEIFDSDEEDNHEEEETVDTEMFQLEQDNEGKSNNTSGLYELLQTTPEVAKASKIPRFSSIRSTGGLSDLLLSSLHKENHHDYTNSKGVNDGYRDISKENGATEYGNNSYDGQKKGVLTKSVSFAVPNTNHGVGSISFGDMSDVEWETFLVIFEKVLPKGMKSMGLKQRLGNSCEF